MGFNSGLKGLRNGKKVYITFKLSLHKLLEGVRLLHFAECINLIFYIMFPKSTIKRVSRV
jgi:hypothetical protein